MKQDFEEVVRENTGWLLTYVRQSVKNSAVAEDLVQEILIKAYRRYDSYVENGMLKAWLRMIARNTLRNYYASAENIHLSLSLDMVMGEDEEESLSGIIPDDSPGPEEALIRKELVDNVMQILASMPPPQRMVLTYRFLDGLSVKQTAHRMGIPQGSVKSSTHYALQKMRKELGMGETQAADSLLKPKSDTEKGENIMKCTDAHLYLFQYAMDKLPENVKKEIADHVESCPSCRDIVTALRELIPHLPKAREGEVTHYNVEFPDIGICYANSGIHFEDAERLNAILEKTGGCVPEGENWLDGGAWKSCPILAKFDNEGEKVEYVIDETAGNTQNYRYRVRKFKKIYDPIHWDHSVFTDHSNFSKPKLSPEAPNLYKGQMANAYGRDVNNGIYIALPANAVNVRIKRGNGVIECGPYQFVYTQRYVLESETLWLEYSFNL